MKVVVQVSLEVDADEWALAYGTPRDQEVRILQMEALMRILLDSGDITPTGQRMVMKVVHSWGEQEE